MTEIQLKTISRIPIITRYFDSRQRKVVILIAPLTKEQEKYLDCRQDITISKYNISSRDVILYGDCDFSTNSKDYNLAKNVNICNSMVKIIANYNYNNHTCISSSEVPMEYTTYRPELIFQYFHGLIGKPTKCIIFKVIR